MPEPTKTPRKITLEELLRLKRHERPGPEYWARFDRELHERVWRALVQPSPTPGLLGGIFGRRARWLAVAIGASAALALVLRPGQPLPSLVVGPRPAIVASNPSAPAPAVLPEAEPVRVAMAVPAVVKSAEPSATDAQPQFAVAALANSSSPAGHHKIPATVAFATKPLAGARYAADTLDHDAFSSGYSGSAY